MYIYLENNYFIPLIEIIVILNYEEFLKSNDGKNFLENNKKIIIDLSKEEKVSVVITNTYIYISSYTCRAIYSRGNEYNNLIVKNTLKKVTEVTNGK